MNKSSEGDSSGLTFPLFVLFGDRTLWSYDTISDVALDADVNFGELRVWDGAGRDVKLARGDAEIVGATILDVETSGRADLQALLADRLRKANVRNVEQLSFDEMVFKASVRFVAPKPVKPGAGILAGLVEGLLQFIGGRP